MGRSACGVHVNKLRAGTRCQQRGLGESSVDQVRVGTRCQQRGESSVDQVRVGTRCQQRGLGESRRGEVRAEALVRALRSCGGSSRIR